MAERHINVRASAYEAFGLWLDNEGWARDRIEENERLRQAFETLDKSRWKNHPTNMAALRGAMESTDETK